ncbi:hypothetical protein BKA67DRAFT_555815 [Truncatella angustata]|uniref:Secreted protein n=1 Tax=Truncatella angustata TaxID=152316 RepID=A0A9P9A255_9PEZI|nr:uncharacterized protein BKA67DRAFT_555815 [Truncatella angustata]KAH6657620.1 hypothetical protein BKA67DRAFT_555815 [Truncatella angustata]
MHPRCLMVIIMIDTSSSGLWAVSRYRCSDLDFAIGMGSISAIRTTNATQCILLFCGKEIKRGGERREGLAFPHADPRSAHVRYMLGLGLGLGHWRQRSGVR